MRDRKKRMPCGLQSRMESPASWTEDIDTETNFPIARNSIESATSPGSACSSSIVGEASAAAISENGEYSPDSAGGGRRGLRRRCTKLVSLRLNRKSCVLPGEAKQLPEQESDMNREKLMTAVPPKKRMRLSSPSFYFVETANRAVTATIAAVADATAARNDKMASPNLLLNANELTIDTPAVTQMTASASAVESREDLAESVSAATTTETPAKATVSRARRLRRETVSASPKLSRRSNPLRATLGCQTLEQTFASITAASSQLATNSEDEAHAPPKAKKRRTRGEAGTKNTAAVNCDDVSDVLQNNNSRHVKVRLRRMTMPAPTAPVSETATVNETLSVSPKPSINTTSNRIAQRRATLYVRTFECPSDDDDVDKDALPVPPAVALEKMQNGMESAPLVPINKSQYVHADKNKMPAVPASVLIQAEEHAKLSTNVVNGVATAGLAIVNESSSEILTATDASNDSSSSENSKFSHNTSLNAIDKRVNELPALKNVRSLEEIIRRKHSIPASLSSSTSSSSMSSLSSVLSESSSLSDSEPASDSTANSEFLTVPYIANTASGVDAEQILSFLNGEAEKQSDEEVQVEHQLPLADELPFMNHSCCPPASPANPEGNSFKHDDATTNEPTAVNNDNSTLYIDNILPAATAAQNDENDKPHEAMLLVTVADEPKLHTVITVVSSPADNPNVLLNAGSKDSQEREQETATSSKLTSSKLCDVPTMPAMDMVLADSNSTSKSGSESREMSPHIRRSNRVKRNPRRLEKERDDRIEFESYDHNKIRILAYKANGEPVSAYYSLEQQLADVKRMERENQAFLKTTNVKYESIEHNECIISKRNLDKIINRGAGFEECNCKADGKPECANYLCINRTLYEECGDECEYGPKCNNQRFQKQTYMPCRLFHADNKGIGVRAEVELKPDDFIMEYVGEVMTNNQYNSRLLNEYLKLNSNHFYCMYLHEESRIDATLKGNIARFINHSCDPNAVCLKWGVGPMYRAGIFCIKPIKPGEEITFDYACTSLTCEQKCYCGSSKCRGTLAKIRKKPAFVEDVHANANDNGDDNADDGDRDVDVEMDVEDNGADSATESDNSQVAELDEQVTKRVTKKRKNRTKVYVAEVKPKRTRTELRPEFMKTFDTSKLPRIPKRKREIVTEDMDVEADVKYLQENGLWKQQDVGRFARLIPRTKTKTARKQLLSILRDAEEYQRKNFLYLRGLRYIHNWLTDDSADDPEYRGEILRTLNVLPISDKKMLIDSNVFATIEKWSHDRRAGAMIMEVCHELIAKWNRLLDFRIPKIQKTDDASGEKYVGVEENPLSQQQQQQQHRGDTSNATTSQYRYSAQNFNRNTSSRYTKPSSGANTSSNSHNINVPTFSKHATVDTNHQSTSSFAAPSTSGYSRVSRYELAVQKFRPTYSGADRRDSATTSAHWRNSKENIGSAAREQPATQWNEASKSAAKVYQISTIDASRTSRPPPGPVESSWPQTASAAQNASSAVKKPLSKEEFRKKFEEEYAREEQRPPDQQQVFEAVCAFFHMDPNTTRTVRLPDYVDVTTMQWFNVYDKPIETPLQFINQRLPDGNLPTNPTFYKLPRSVDGLPPNWAYAITTYGKIYFYNRLENKATWHPPSIGYKLPVIVGEMRPEYDDEGFIEVDPAVVGESNRVDLDRYRQQLLDTRRYRRKVSLVEQRDISPRCEADRLYNQQEVIKYKANKEKIRQRKDKYVQNQLGHGVQSNDVISRLGNAVVDLYSESNIYDYLLSSDDDNEEKNGVPLPPLVESIVREPMLSWKELMIKDTKRKRDELYASLQKPLDEELTPLARDLEQLRRMTTIQGLLDTFCASVHAGKIKETLQLKKQQQIKHVAKKQKLAHKDESSQPESSKRSREQQPATTPKGNSENCPEADAFRNEIAGTIFAVLRHYRNGLESKCSIVSNKDFNYLMRKIPSHVLQKETRGGKRELKVTTNVRNKTIAYVHTYLSNKGPIFRIPHADTHEYKDIPAEFYLPENV